MGALGTIIVILITAGVTYYLTEQAVQGGPISLTPDVQRYVDARLSGAGNADQEIQTLSSRLAEMETKLIKIEKIRSGQDRLAEKSELIESAISEQQRRKEDVINMARTTELNRLRSEMATACAGVTIKRGRGAGPGRSAIPNRGQGAKTP